MAEKAPKPYAVKNGWEYWLLGGNLYRNRQGDRAYMLPEGIPANARWECSLAHFNADLKGKDTMRIEPLPIGKAADTDNRKAAICSKKSRGCGKQVEACTCHGNGAHPWDCTCTRCNNLASGKGFAKDSKRQRLHQALDRALDRKFAAKRGAKN